VAPAAAALGRAGEAQRAEVSLFNRKLVVSEDGFARARKAAPGYDIHHLLPRKGELVARLRFAGIDQARRAAFSSFCRKRHERARRCADVDHICTHSHICIFGHVKIHIGSEGPRV
jgi:hypothetical protein